MSVGYDARAVNPRWVAKRLDAGVTGGTAPVARAAARFLYRLARQRALDPRDMWHGEDLGDGYRTPQDGWLAGGPAGVAANQWTRGHLIASSYAAGSVVGMLSTMSTANAANQPAFANNNVWNSIEDGVRTAVINLPAGEHIYVVVGVDGVHGNGAPVRLHQAHQAEPAPQPARASVDPAMYWTALLRPHVVTAHAGGPPLENYDHAAMCGAVVFACFNKQNYAAQPPGAAASVAARRRMQCAYFDVDTLTAATDVDPFPGLAAELRSCSAAQVEAARAMFYLPAL